VEKLIRELKNRGYRVGAFKHDAHRFDIDHPGKDSYRFTTAGADTMIITSPDKMAMVKMHSQSPPVEELLDRYFSDVDIVLIEGFKRLNLPKIEKKKAMSFSVAAMPMTQPLSQLPPMTLCSLMSLFSISTTQKALPISLKKGFCCRLRVNIYG